MKKFFGWVLTILSVIWFISGLSHLFLTFSSSVDMLGRGPGTQLLFAVLNFAFAAIGWHFGGKMRKVVSTPSETK